MPDMGAIAAALSSLKAAKDIAESMIGLRDGAAFQAKLIEFQFKLIDANNAAFAAQDERTALLQRISELEKEVADFETWETEKQRYQLVAPAPNVMAYAIKEAVRGSEPPHYLCANCFTQRKKSFLNQHIRGQYYDEYLCATCGEKLIIDKGDPPQDVQFTPDF
jgi:DNA-directed RNA polymerase subunit RPC12/RpoP